MDEEAREKHVVKLSEGKEVARLRQNSWARGEVGLGGREVELQVWDLAAASQHQGPVFRSKNVRQDALCLRQPVWVSDLAWTSPATVAVCTRHGQVPRQGSDSLRQWFVVWDEISTCGLSNGCCCDPVIITIFAAI